MKKIILTIIIIMLFLGLKAQNDLTNHRDFFKSKEQELIEWLNTNNLSKIIKLETIEVKKEKVYVVFNVKDKHNWDRLDSLTQKIDDKTISTIIFRKCVFLMDLNHEQCKVEVETSDYYIYISYLNGIVNTSFEQKMGEISDNINIEIGEIKGLIGKGKTQSKYTIEEVKNRLDMSLKNHYKKYEHWWADYTFKNNGDGNWTVISIENIKGPILGGSYFEKIIIEFKFEVRNNIVGVKYDWQAKYGSGIFRVYDGDYKDIEIKFREKMEIYNVELKSLISKSIKLKQ